ncbi:unnamed protein product [Macrosiphum euphorbiae]|uniref:Uncharacterized protein n=1 Tax=Macrosiphum euphorbiae TaxID=13131 RepID=A0AAV0XGD8_9HEMI|nr:unnamed protein product [Macrosiphum euphorbiae]CAI6358174.1 unnamed protein product [Macrosiphum euphorbiae]CAI6367186.1 unnamed protein product [Macrosiphum euphorbiae]
MYLSFIRLSNFLNDRYLTVFGKQLLILRLLCRCWLYVGACRLVQHSNLLPFENTECCSQKSSKCISKTMDLVVIVIGW